MKGCPYYMRAAFFLNYELRITNYELWQFNRPVSVQESEHPQGNFIIDAVFNIVGGNIRIGE